MTKQGAVYDAMPFKEYRSKTEFVSVSELKAFEESPFQYQQKYILKKEEEQEKRQGAQALGSLCHCLLLEPEKFESEYYVSDVRQDARTKLFQSVQEDAGSRTIINYKTLEKAKECVTETLWEMGTADLKGFKKEISFFYTGPHFKLPVKARFDMLSSDGFIYDYKTTQAKIDNASVSQEIDKWRYHWQAAYYLDIFEAIEGQRLKGFKWVFQQTVYPFACKVYEAHPDLLTVGRLEYQEQLEELAKAKLVSQFPKLRPQNPIVNLPTYRLTRFFKKEI